MIRSEVDRRAKRYAPRQCLSDVGMHKDAPERQWLENAKRQCAEIDASEVAFFKELKRRTRSFAPLKDELRRLQERRP